MLEADSRNLVFNLRTVATCFLRGGNKFKTLKIRYTSCFEGQIDAVRDSIEGKLPKGMPERDIIIKDCHGKYHHVKRAEAYDYFFKYGTILAPLLCLKGIAEDVKVRGDLPQKYMDDLTTDLSVAGPAPVTKKKQIEEEVERKNREAHRMPGFHALIKEFAKKHEGKDDGMAEWYRDAIRTPDMSPAVLEELFKEPTKEELETSQSGALGSGSNVASFEDVTEFEQVDGGIPSSKHIGYLNGKPVFGPVRPPKHA